MKMLFALLLTMMFAVPAIAGTVTLAWDPSPTAEVTGYIVYYDKDGAVPWEYKKDVGDVLTYPLTNLSAGTWYFTVAAYNTQAESEISNVVNGEVQQYTPPAKVMSTGPANPS